MPVRVLWVIKGLGPGGAETLLANAAAFSIDWSDLQLNLPNPEVPAQFYIANVGNAHSRGAELELSSHPQPDLHRNLASLQFEQDRSSDKIATNLGLRLGRLYESPRDERLSYVELLRSRETAGTEVTTHRALSTAG